MQSMAEGIGPSRVNRGHKNGVRGSTVHPMHGSLRGQRLNSSHFPATLQLQKREFQNGCDP